MAVQLSSLRVETSLDASGYARGAQAKVAADQAMIAAGQQSIAMQAAYTDALNKNTAALRAAAAAKRTMSPRSGAPWPAAKPPRSAEHGREGTDEVREAIGDLVRETKLQNARRTN